MNRVEKHIPAPRHRNGGLNERYFFADLAEIGDSRFYPGVDRHRVSAAASKWGSRQVPRTWYATQCATEDGVEGVRVWRVG